MHDLLALTALPLTIGFVVLIVAGYYELKTYRVPNKISLLALVGALAFAVTKSCVVPDSHGGIGPALLGMLLGGALLIPLYSKLGLGAGCVKTQAAFGAWLGCALDYRSCAIALVAATICAVVILAATCWSSARVLEDDPDHASRFAHGQFPLSIGAVIGVVAINFI